MLTDPVCRGPQVQLGETFLRLKARCKRRRECLSYNCGLGKKGNAKRRCIPGKFKLDSFCIAGEQCKDRNCNKFKCSTTPPPPAPAGPGPHELPLYWTTGINLGKLNKLGSACNGNNECTSYNCEGHGKKTCRRGKFLRNRFCIFNEQCATQHCIGARRCS